ncbi:MAG: glycosyltransferase family 39 protein [Xenococcaceae cyanobacterium]
MRQNRQIYGNWWRILIIILLILGIFFRFANLEQKPYWGDESLTSHRIAGYTFPEVQEIVSQNRVFTVAEIQKYQRPDPEKDLMNLVKKGLRSPLYHLIGRSWMELFSDRVTTPRGVSALISLLAFPCMYLLCQELFASPLVGWMAVSLISISPLHLIYAQEAREYSMWTVTVLLSCWALLRAIRVNKMLNWIVYAATLMLTLYTHLFSVIIAIGHGLYLLIAKLTQTSQLPQKQSSLGEHSLSSYPDGEYCQFDGGLRVSQKKPRINKKIIPHLLISFIVFSLFALGKIADYKGFPSPPCWTGWSTDHCGISSHTPFPSLAQTWILNLSRVFFDFNESFNYKNLWLYLPIIVLVVYSLYFLYIHTQKQVWLFIYILIGTLGLFLIIPDLILKGQGSTPIRYLIPCYLGIEIAIAHLLATNITSLSQKIWEHKLWIGITLVLISSGVLSCAVYTQTDTWWNKYAEYYHSEVAKIVNQTNNSLVIAPWFNMLTLSHVLASDVTMQDIRGEQEVNFVAKNFNNVFIYKSKGSLEYFLNHNLNYKIKDVYVWKRQTTPVNTTQTKLWHLVNSDLAPRKVDRRVDR